MTLLNPDVSSRGPDRAMNSQAALPPASEAGSLGISQLKRLWARAMATQQRRSHAASKHDRHRDYLVIHASGLGLEQTMNYLARQAPSFEEF